MQVLRYKMIVIIMIKPFSGETSGTHHKKLEMSDVLLAIEKEKTLTARHFHTGMLFGTRSTARQCKANVEESPKLEEVFWICESPAMFRKI